MENNIRRLRKAAGWTQQQLADRVGMHLTNMNRIERGKVALTTTTMVQIAEALGVTPTEIIQPRRMVPVKGRIGAGGQIEAIDAGDVDEVDAPPDAPDETVAGIVAGLSMLPVFEDSTIIYWSRLLPPDQMINRRCVVQLSDGRIMVKVLRPGSKRHLWTLLSINPAFSEIEDVEVEWAAPIDWIKPRT